ncbi:MAG: efflux RND transporter periplasmic adaptor subunit [Pirellulales bacterium]
MSTVDPDEVQRAKREIQGIVQQIADLAQSNTESDRFYDEYLNKVVAALAAVGGAVWTTSDAGIVSLTYQINLRATGLIENPIGQAQHGRLLQSVLTSSEGALVQPHSGFGGGTDADDEHAPANPTDYLLVLAPLCNDQGPQGVIEVFQRPGSSSKVQRGYLQFLLQTCELAGLYLRNSRLRYLSQKQTLWEQLETFTRTAHEKLDVRQTAYTVANEGRRLIGCDRVTVAVQRGSRVIIESISGQDTFDKRSNVATLLTKLARAVTRTGEDVWYSGDTVDMAPQVEKALEAYVDESHTKSMAILPLVPPAEAEEAPTPGEKVRPQRVLGALIVEQMVDSQEPEGFRQRIDVVRTHSATALANALEHESLFLMPLWKALGKATWLVRGRTLPKTLAVIALILGLVAAAVLVPADFTLEGRGRLRPEVLRNVFAGIDGDVDEVLVKDDQHVAAGDVVVRLQSTVIGQEIEALRGQKAAALGEINAINSDLFDRRRLTPAEEQQKEARIGQLRSDLVSIDAQMQLQEVNKKKLEVRSPIAGRVITWKVDESLLDRPVGKEQILMEIANTDSPWLLEVMMPEARMGHIAEAAAESEEPLKVEFILATHPGEPFIGRVIEQGSTAEVRGDQGNTVKLRVAFDDQHRLRELFAGNPKVGAEAIAKVHCGTASIGYVYLHDLIDFVRAKILFRF